MNGTTGSVPDPAGGVNQPPATTRQGRIIFAGKAWLYQRFVAPVYRTSSGVRIVDLVAAAGGQR